MTMTISRQRNSPVMLVIRMTQAGSTIVPLLLAWLSIRTRWPVIFGVPVDLVVAVASGIAVLGLIVDWWMTRFSFGPSGINFEKGLVFRRSTSLGWAEIISVQVSRSPICRAFGCGRVTIGIGAESKSNLVIEAVPNSIAAALESHFNARRDRPPVGGEGENSDETMQGSKVRPPIEGETTSASNTGDLIYRIRVRDYFMLSFTYGQFVLIIPFVLALYENISEVVPVPSILPNFSLHPDSVPILVLTILLWGLPAALGFGMLVAWLRYRSFEVRLRARVFEMSGGLVSTDSRLVSSDQVLGLKIAQNPLMRLTGHARLGFVSRQAGERLSANVLFPAVRLSFLRDGIRTHFPDYADAANRPCPVGRSLAWSLIGFDAAILALGSLAFGRMSIVPLTLTMVSLAFVLLVATNYCWAAVELNPENGVIVFRRGFIWVKYYVVSCDSVYFVESYILGIAGRLSAPILCIGVHDTRALRLWAPAGSASLLEKYIEMKSKNMVSTREVQS